MLVDSHCHLDMLDLTPYRGSLQSLIEKAKNVGVEYILCAGVDLVNAERIITNAEQFNNVSVSIGLHPSKKVDHEPVMIELVELANHPKVRAIGETGLDYCYNETSLDTMRDRFRRHIQVSIRLDKPLIIHSRNAPVDTIQIMRQENAKLIGGVMHCFTESWEMAKQAMELGFYISFSGIVTFKNAKNVSEIAERVPLEKMLIETDSPYLAPVPFRGKKNEPQYVRYVAEYLAKLKNISLEEVAETTTQNFYQLFNLL